MDQPYVGEKAPPHEVQLAVDDAFRSGRSIDDAAAAGLAVARNPIMVIKALRNASPGLSLADAKPIVDRNLSPDFAAATAELRALIEKELDEASDHAAVGTYGSETQA